MKLKRHLRKVLFSVIAIDDQICLRGFDLKSLICCGFRISCPGPLNAAREDVCNTAKTKFFPFLFLLVDLALCLWSELVFKFGYFIPVLSKNSYETFV